MIIKIYGKEYHINKKLAASSKKILCRILEKIREESDIMGLSKFYVAFVVMMYVTSSTILSSMGTEKIRQITDEVS